MNTAPIGIIDSGVGGLTIWQEVVSQLPQESTIYIADQAHLPYGEKTQGQLLAYGKKLISFLQSQKVKLIVLACNTLTVSCLDELRRVFPELPIIGTVPVVKTAVEHTKTGSIAILSTMLTAESEYQHTLIEQFAKECETLNIGTNALVPLIERGEIDSPKMLEVLNIILGSLREREVDTLALGCTHYAFIKIQIQQVVGPEILLLDSAAAVARQVKRILEANNQRSRQHSPQHQFFTTAATSRSFGAVCRQLLPSTLLDSPSTSFATAVI